MDRNTLVELGYNKRAIDYNILKIWNGEIGDNYQIIESDIIGEKIIFIEDELMMKILNIDYCKDKYKTSLANSLVKYKNNYGNFQGYYIFCNALLKDIKEFKERIAEEKIKKEKELQLKKELYKNDIENKEKNRKLVFEVIESIVEPVGGVYVLDRNAQNKLYHTLKDAGWQLSVSKILFALDIKKSYGERDKNNWSVLYVYQDNFELDEDKYDELVEKVIENWQSAPYITDISDMFKLDKNRKYIYGIKIDGRLVYIGKTMRGLKNRILEHLTEDKKVNPYLYKAMGEFDFQFVVLYEDKDEILASDLDLQIIEKKLIMHFKPSFNKEGVTRAYVYR